MCEIGAAPPTGIWGLGRGAAGRSGVAGAARGVSTANLRVTTSPSPPSATGWRPPTETVTAPASPARILISLDALISCVSPALNVRDRGRSPYGNLGTRPRRCRSLRSRWRSTGRLHRELARHDLSFAAERHRLAPTHGDRHSSRIACADTDFPGCINQLCLTGPECARSGPLPLRESGDSAEALQVAPESLAQHGASPPRTCASRPLLRRRAPPAGAHPRRPSQLPHRLRGY